VRRVDASWLFKNLVRIDVARPARDFRAPRRTEVCWFSSRLDPIP
jgi:hypothetical protein